MGDGQPVDVFWCSAPKGKEREAIAERSLDWWRGVDCVKVHIVTPSALHCDIGDFNRLRRVYSDKAAATDPYILTDDDCFPVCSEDGTESHSAFRDYLERGVETLRRHPDFAILSWWPINATINRWTEIEAFEDLQVTEHVSVGGIRMCRKGHILCWPQSDGVGYDRTQADYIRKIGRKVGYFQHLRMKHEGEAKSTLWPNTNQS